MDMALGAANWLLGKVIKKLSDDLVAGYVASTELGPNMEKIKTELMYTLGLLHEASQGRYVSNNPGLQGLLESLSTKADEAEDALDELHYFMIQDEIDGTQDAAPNVGDNLGSEALHVSHGVRHATGNWRSYFCFCRTQDDVDSAAVANSARNINGRMSENDINGHVEKLPFNRANMSNKIKLIIKDIQSLCDPINKLLNIHPSSSHIDTLNRQTIGSTITQDKLYGRDAIYCQTIKDMTSGKHQAALSVLPIVGPGGIGKTTFTQHLYNDKRVENYFTIRVWLCLSSKFDLLKLTKEILGCILAVENEGSTRANETNNLDQLQICIAQRLKFKRFLIVLDDMWKCSEREWETLLAPFRKGEAENGSMILVTTRLPYIAEMVRTSNPIHLRGLEPSDFWEFFQACVFGEVTDRHDIEHRLIDIARQIANRLKCSPLAAKTVGRLLKKKPSWEHWIEILEKKEWLNQKHEEDIMPALKISYDYLSFELQKCFSYFSLFPEDHKFDKLEITNYWVAIGIIDSSSHNANSYLEDLEDSGFLMKGYDSSHHYYVMHDLLHELSQIVSSQECLNISCTTFRADAIPPSIRHMSFTIQDMYDDEFMREMGKLKRQVDIQNLRSLMFFGEHHSVSIANALNDMFKEIKGLRVLFIYIDSPRSLPDNFSKLIHLRYLKIGSPSYSNMNLPRTIYRFYHLKFLNIEHWRAKKHLHEDISNLVNLHHLIAKKEFYSNVPKVGKMKCLLELKEFHIKKKDVGFELRELGHLEELGGELSIHGLENVMTREEATEAKLLNKRNLHKLRLVWSREQLALSTKQRETKAPASELDVLDGLEPQPNIRRLCIINHRGSCGPNWLCREIGMTNLESLHLEGVSWDIFPPFGQMPYLRKLKLINIAGMRQFGPDFGSNADRGFANLKMVFFYQMPELVNWAADTNHKLFSGLESVKCVDCPKLTGLPFLECSGPSTQDTNTTYYPKLCSLWVERCNKLSLPPLPHRSMLKCFIVQADRNRGLFYEKKLLKVFEYTGYLAFQNLDEVEKMEINDFSHMSLTDLDKLNALSSLHVKGSDHIFSGDVDSRIAFHSIRRLHLERFYPTTESLSKFNYFQDLSELRIDGLVGYNNAIVLQLPSTNSLCKVEITKCNGLFLSVEGGGLCNHTLLQSLKISECGHMFSRWGIGEGAETIKPLPTSLRELVIVQQPSLQSMALLSNLTSLTKLVLAHCNNLTIDGFNSQIMFNLKHLEVHNSSWRFESPHDSIAADLLAEVARTETAMPAGAFQLEHLVVDTISAVLVAPICSRFSSTLRFLTFLYDLQAEIFTEEQVLALQRLTSLQCLQFRSCKRLRTLPQGLQILRSVKELVIDDCHNIRSLPEEGLPSWMELTASGCSEELRSQLNQSNAKNRI